MIFRSYLFCVCLILACAGSALAETRLRGNPSVSGTQITVGDIFTDAGAAARARLGPAPDPGQTIAYNRRQLLAIARAYGLSWKPQGGGQFVVVSSALRIVEKQDITDAIAHELTRLDVPGQIRVELTGRARFPRLTVAADAPDPRVARIDFDRHTGRLYADISLPGHGNEIRFQGRTEIMIELPVVTRNFKRGETVADGDVAWRKIRMTGLPSDLIMRSKDLVGMSVRRTLRPGRAIVERDLRTPILVRKGHIVVMQLLAPGITLTSSGRALGDAARGESVQIMNSRSKRTVEGIAVGPDKVIIPLRQQAAVTAAR